MVRKTNLMPVIFSLSCRPASSPFNKGIALSTTITCGLMELMESMSAWPSAKVATT
jgi:hypothetical protein